MSNLTTAQRTKFGAFTLYHLTLAFLLGALVGVFMLAGIVIGAGSANASVTLVETADVTPGHPIYTANVRITHATRIDEGRLQFATNDGAVYIATPCEVEDSANCWWDAKRRGNHVGTPVVNMGGVYLPVKVRIRGGHLPALNVRTLPECDNAAPGGVVGPCAWLGRHYETMPPPNYSADSFRVYANGRIKPITDRRAWQLLHGLANHDRAGR